MVRGGCKRPLSSVFGELPFHSRGAAGAACPTPPRPTRHGAFPTVTLGAETRSKGGVRGRVDENQRAINQRNLAMPPSRRTTMWQPRRKCPSGASNMDAKQTHSAVARPADWLLGRSVVPPLPAPVVLFQLFPCGRRWHSQNPITPSFRLWLMAPQFKSQRTPCLGPPVCVSIRPRQVLSKSSQSIALLALAFHVG